MPTDRRLAELHLRSCMVHAENLLHRTQVRDMRKHPERKLKLLTEVIQSLLVADYWMLQLEATEGATER